MSQPQGQYRRWGLHVPLNVGNAVTVKVPLNATSTIYVRKITLSITTHAAVTFLARDTNGTPFVIAAHTDASAAAGVPSVVTWDFGTDGVALNLGKTFEVIAGAAIAGVVYAEGYEVFTA